jgi:hypothetical protein
MTVHDDDRPGDDGVHRSAPAFWSRLGRRQAMAGAIGLAAVLGGGSYLLTTQLTSGNDTTATSEVGPLGPVGASASSTPGFVSAAPSVAGSAATPTAAAQAVSPGPASAAATTAPAPTTDAAKVRKEVQEAREKAAKDGVSLKRPLTAKGGPIEGLSTRTENTANGTIRITTAKSDLTGRQDQLMAADAGKAVGRARCTQKLHFSNADTREIPTILLCWRTSDSRSVVTLAVARTGKPSMDASVAVIDREWARLR